MKKSIVLATVLAMSLSLSSAFISLAGQWQQSSIGWWYQEDDGSYPVNTWKELDGKWYYFNQDGYMVSNAWVGNYYLGSDGVMLTNTTTPDGYNVGPDGAWIQNENPMAGIECSSKWLMGVIYPIEDLGDKYKITGDVSDYQAVIDYLSITGSAGAGEPEYDYLDSGFRKSNVTIYVDKNTKVGFYPWSVLDSAEFMNELRAKNLNELLLSDYPRAFAFDLNGDVVTAIYDVDLNYVN